MSRGIYDLLKQVELIDSYGKPAPIDTLDERVLREKLSAYHRGRVEGAEKEVKAERVGVGELAALRSSLSSASGVVQELPSALVYQRFFVDDPLFRPATPPREVTRSYNQWLGLRDDISIDRDRVAQALTYLSEMAPLVRAGACSILPVSLLHQGSEQIPIFSSPDYFESDVPEGVRELVRNSAVIREMGPLPNGAFAIYDRTPEKPTRGIQIKFADDFVPNGHPFYLLSEARAAGPERNGRIPIVQTLNWDDPPDKPYFDAWVTQSINKTAINRLTGVGAELRLADALNAAYVTESEFESKLLGADTAGDPRSMRTNAVNFLTANAPFLNITSPEAVVNIREKHHLLFHKFQASLLHVSSQLLSVDSGYEEKAQALYVKEIEPQVREINTQLTKVRWQGAANALTAAATLSLAMVKPDAIPYSVPLAFACGLATAIQSVCGALPALGEYLQKRKGPAFIWSKLAKG